MHWGRGAGLEKPEARGGAAVAIAVTSGVAERTRPLPHARARVRAYTHGETGTHARAPPLSVRHTGGKGQTKGEGAGRPEGAAAARHDGRGRDGFLAADAAEPLLPPRPRPPPPAPRAPSPGARASPRPLLPAALRARVGPRARAGWSGRGRVGGPAASAPRPPPTPSAGPSAGVRQVSAVGGGRRGERVSAAARAAGGLSPLPDPFRGC